MDVVLYSDGVYHTRTRPGTLCVEAGTLGIPKLFVGSVALCLWRDVGARHKHAPTELIISIAWSPVPLGNVRTEEGS